MKAITTRQDAINFIHGCILFIGPGFHPDTPMGGYVTGNDFPLLNTGAAIHYTHLLADCHDMLGEDIYQVGLGLMQKLGYAPAPTEAADWNAEAARLGEMREKAIQELEAIAKDKERVDFPATRHWFKILVNDENGPYLASGNITAFPSELRTEELIECLVAVQKAIAERGEGK